MVHAQHHDIDGSRTIVDAETLRLSSVFRHNVDATTIIPHYLNTLNAKYFHKMHVQHRNTNMTFNVATPLPNFSNPAFKVTIFAVGAQICDTQRRQPIRLISTSNTAIFCVMQRRHNSFSSDIAISTLSVPTHAEPRRYT